jgi:hypothetical protein
VKDCGKLNEYCLAICSFCFLYCISLSLSLYIYIYHSLSLSALGGCQLVTVKFDFSILMKTKKNQSFPLLTEGLARFMMGFRKRKRGKKSCVIAVRKISVKSGICVKGQGGNPRWKGGIKIVLNGLAFCKERLSSSSGAMNSAMSNGNYNLCKQQ